MLPSRAIYSAEHLLFSHAGLLSSWTQTQHALQVLASVSANSIAPGLDVTLTGIIPDTASGKVFELSKLFPTQQPSTSNDERMHMAHTAILAPSMLQLMMFV